MKKYNFIFLLIAAINLQVQAQVESASFLDKTEFKVGYYGNLIWNNGLNIGGEYAWKEKKKGQKMTTRQLLLNGSIGYSTNFTNQTDNGLSTHYGFIWRKTKPNKKQINLEINPIGYHLSFLPETYEAQGNEVSKIGFPGRSYYAPSIAFGIGRLREGKRRSAWYLNLNCTLRTPHNGSVLPVFTFQYGHRFNLKKNN